MRQVPQPRLRVLAVPQGNTQVVLRKRIERSGVSPDRLILLPRMHVRAYFSAIAETSVALDTSPYNGATTRLDALWQGIPIVALTGDRPVARSGTSILRTLGITELVAETPSQYVDITVRLAHDAAWRIGLSQSLHERLLRSPLMDHVGFTRDLEERFREIHG